MGINALVVPMGCRAEHYPEFLRSVSKLENIRGALITFPHKVGVRENPRIDWELTLVAAVKSAPDYRATFPLVVERDSRPAG